jgi:thiol-disulfide isomerase/thioredoxin
MMRCLIVSVLLLAACAHNASQHIVLSLSGLDCADCGVEKIVPALKTQPGVHDVRFDRVKVEVTVDADLGVEPQALVQAVEQAGYHASIGPGHGAYQAMATYPEAADVKTIARGGQDVELAPVLGKATVVDFYAEWCGPCHEVDEHLAQLLAKRSDIAVRKIEIVDWNSPAAKHYLTKASEIPYQIVFDKQGRQVAIVSGFDLGKLDAAIEAAAR